MEIGGERNMDWTKYEEKNLNVVDAFAKAKSVLPIMKMEDLCPLNRLM